MGQTLLSQIGHDAKVWIPSRNTRGLSFLRAPRLLFVLVVSQCEISQCEPRQLKESSIPVYKWDANCEIPMSKHQIAFSNQKKQFRWSLLHSGHTCPLFHSLCVFTALPQLFSLHFHIFFFHLANCLFKRGPQCVRSGCNGASGVLALVEQSSVWCEF